MNTVNNSIVLDALVVAHNQVIKAINLAFERKDYDTVIKHYDVLISILELQKQELKELT
jgi:hypothetical protein